ncbi:hypothetical protein IMCC9480_2837 [Oxalobacteraceae bacterium IMCC9480]|nr:hypothetical protein IMCC9480_2837 [Oxalobacteraceae bacterium IMCC9480]
MAVREPRKKIRPGQRSGIRIRDVDLDLRDHDEQRHRGQRPGRIREHVAERDQVHPGRFDGLIHRHQMLDCEVGQQRTAQHFGRAEHDPAGSGQQQGGPPAHPVGRGFFGQETQEVDLLADLRDQRKGHRRGGTEQGQVERSATFGAAGKMHQVGQGGRFLVEHAHIRQHQQHDPDGLGPELQTTDPGDAPGHHRDDHQRTGNVAERQRQAEIQLHRLRHDRCFERKENEGERRIDQRRDGRADVAEAGTARQQVHVDAVSGGVITDRQTSQEDQHRHAQDGPERIRKSVAQRDRAAYRFKREERHGPHRGIGQAELGPLAKRARREAQRVVFQRFIGDEGVVVAADLDDALGGGRRHWVLRRKGTRGNWS